MRNYIQPANVITAVAPDGGIKSDDVLIVGALIGVCAIDAAEGAETELMLVGCFELPKAAGAITAGAVVYWDATAKAVTTTTAGNTLLGAAIAAASADDPTVRVRLVGTVSA